MEGTLWTRSGLLGAMQRRFCALKGTMLASYGSEEELRRGARPRDVFEVAQARDWDGATALRVYAHALELECLGAPGKLQCHAESAEGKRRWLLALRHALAEPDRIAQDEIDAAQRQLAADAAREQQALARAADAVREAQSAGGDARAHGQRMQESAAERHALEAKLQLAQSRRDEARRKAQETRAALLQARQSAHDAALAAGAGDASDAPDAAQLVAVERLAAQLEVDANLEETCSQDVDALDERVVALSREFAELFRTSRERADDGQKLRADAASSLQQAQAAQQRARLRVESWSAAPSHLDPLAEGYLVCKHPFKPTTHRRYYVLVGNTLCWYKDADRFAALPASPVGVVHVSGVGEWTGRVGAAMKVLPHTFAVITVEGKLLCCSAPTRQSVTAWTTALHIGVTMPPLSPHRAVAAKSRRDSFDLLASMTAALSPKTSSTGHFQFPRSSEADGGRDAAAVGEQQIEDASASTGSSDPEAPPTRAELEATVVVEGYLVKKSALVPVMKKKYCVLRGLRLSVFSSHEAYAASSSRSSNRDDSDELQVCGVSDWDGHGALLHYAHGFQVQTLRHQSVFCSAASSDEKDKWVHGVRRALLKHRERLLSPLRREESMINRARKSILLKTPGVSSTEPVDDAAAALDELHALLHEFYAEHNPGKLGDVPMLLERYKHRERALLEHLDRIYGTDVAHDEQVAALLDRLAQPPPPGHARRKSSGVKSGLADFVKMAGYLGWNGDRCFCVLSVNRLVRYRTQTHYETEAYAPVAAIGISSVYEYPPPADVAPSAASKHTFFVAYADDPGDGSAYPHQQPLQHSLALSAATVEEKLTWMAKIRSGLGFAHANAERSAASASKPDAVAPSEALRRKLVAFYTQHNPRKVGDVGALLSYFAGNEAQLVADLDATYGTRLAEDPEVAQLVSREGDASSAASSDDAARADTTAAAGPQYESYLWVKHPALGAAFRKCYCVLSGDAWSCYSLSRDAHADAGATNLPSGSERVGAPLLADVVVNLHARSAKLQEMNATLSIETLASGSVLLRADADQLAQHWTRELRRAADKHQLETHARQLGSAPSSPTRRASSLAAASLDPQQQLHVLLVAFYARHNADKAGEVGPLLRVFAGRERKLLEEIDAIYGTDVRADPEFADALQVIEDAQPAADPSDEHAAGASGGSGDDPEKKVLMEGYLTKRGHLIPSMRKRYCVLTGATLAYFATHEDSRNPAVRPHGSFEVAVATDWHGRTAAKTFEHGLELETADGKSFFCAALTGADKAAWMRAFQHGIAVARAAAAPRELGADGVDDEAEDGSEEDRAARTAELRDRLARFYRETNPSKLEDLDLLLACYTHREVALLEAIDAAYGSALAQDASLLALLPASSAYRRALHTLQFDGALVKFSDSSWRRGQRVHVALSELALAFFASREGFKGGAASDKSVTVLTVKSAVQASESSKPRFAVETTEHAWLFFEAPSALEKTQWVEVLQAALDAILGQSLLAAETLAADGSRARPQLSRRRSSFTMGSSLSGYLLVRLDFASDAEHAKKRDTALEERHFVLESNNRLVVYSEAQDAVAATFTTLGTRAWEPASAGGGSSSSSSSAPLSPKGDAKCRFPFQILTLEQVVLTCSAATDVLRAKWIKQIRTGAERVVALEMLHDQRLQVETGALAGSTSNTSDDDVAPTSSAIATGGDASSATTDSAMRGYLEYKTSSDPGLPGASAAMIEGYVVVTTRAAVTIYADEGACLRREKPLVAAQVAELVTSSAPTASSPAKASATPSSPAKAARRHLYKLFGDDSSAPADDLPLAFTLQTRDKRAKFVHLFPASSAQQAAWISALRSGINLLKGEELLADEKLMLQLEQQTREEEAEERDATLSSGADAASLPTVTTGATLDGTLTPWRVAFGSSRPTAAATPLFCVLTECRLRGFASRDDVPETLNAPRTEGKAASSSLLDVDVVAVSDWEVPAAAATSKTRDDTARESEGGVGFRLEVTATASTARESLYFAAASAELKTRWVRAIKNELDFALAETYLDEDAKEFARQVAAHVADTAAVSSSSSDGAGGGVRKRRNTTLQPQRTDGYVRVRHHFLGAIWRERFAVLEATSLRLYADASSASGADREHRALEKHDLVAVEPWHPTYAVSLGGSSRFGFRVENEAGGYLECTVGSEAELAQWMAAVAAAVADLSLHSSSRVMLRDAALPFIPGAAMEGYLKLKETKKTKLALFWKTRYCAVVGTQWLLYETQEQAAAERDGGGGVPPVAVYEVVQVGPWTRPGRSSSRMLDDSDELLARGFSVRVGPDGARVDCKAQSSLERKRWLNAMEDELAQAAQASAHVLAAMERHHDSESAKAAVRSKFSEVTSDARRQSTVLRHALQLATIDDGDDEPLGSGSSSSNGESDAGDGDDEHNSRVRPRSGSDFIDRSPESSPMRRKSPVTIGGAFANMQEPDASDANKKTGADAYLSIVACFARCFSRRGSEPSKAPGARATPAGRSIAPLGVPGFPANADAWHRRYRCEYYTDDGYSSESDW